MEAIRSESSRNKRGRLLRVGEVSPHVSTMADVDTNVHELMEHIHQLVAAEPFDGVGSVLWTNLDMVWDRIHFRLQNAAREGGAEAALSRYLPQYPVLFKLGRLLGLRHLRRLILLPCKLVLQLLRRPLFRAARWQDRVHLSLVSSSRGLAFRLADCESTLLDQHENISALERRLNAQIKAQAVRIRVLEDQLAERLAA